MNHRTLIYARVSTEDQVEKYGLPLQLRASRDYAAARQWTIIKEITDDGVSGVVLSRPGLDRVRQLVASGEADHVVMVDVDRLSRELAHLLILKPEIEKKASLEFVNAKFEDSPSGRLFFGIRGVIAQYEREQTRERTMRGKKERARAGLIVGGRTAYGYLYQEGKLLPDEQRAPIVRSIFAWFDSGMSMRSITLRLRAMGAPTWSGRKWGHSSVRRILVNESYAGVAYYGTLVREGKLLKRRESGERIALSVPALISHEQWDRAQARIAVGLPRGVTSKQHYLLRGLLYCKCGRRMSGEQNRRYLSYRCHGRDSLIFKGGPCKAAAPAVKLDQAVWQVVSRAFTDAEFLRGILREHQQELQVYGPDRAEFLSAQVTRMKRKEDACLAALLDPDLAGGHAAIKAEYRKVQVERQRVEHDLAATERSRRKVQTAGAWLEDTVEALREYIPTLDTLPERQEFLRGLVERAEWNGEFLRIECSFGLDMATSSSRCAKTGNTQATDLEPLKIVLTARLAA